MPQPADTAFFTVPEGLTHRETLFDTGPSGIAVALPIRLLPPGSGCVEWSLKYSRMTQGWREARPTNAAMKGSGENR